MTTIGIITCETLALEIVQVLAEDPDVERVTVVEADSSMEAIRRLESLGMRQVQTIPMARGFRPEDSDRPEVLLRALPLTLHGRVEALRRAVVSAARGMAASVDAFLFGYGLCGHAFEPPTELEELGVPIVFPMDGGRLADDCIGVLLGGQRPYRAELLRVAGTFFVTPGWALHWRRILTEEALGASPSMLRRVFAGYERMLLVVTPAMEEEEMRLRVCDLNRMLGLSLETRTGSVEMLSHAWKVMREAVSQRTDT
jgi:hypothetical protein